MRASKWQRTDLRFGERYGSVVAYLGVLDSFSNAGVGIHTRFVVGMFVLRPKSIPARVSCWDRPSIWRAGWEHCRVASAYL